MKPNTFALHALVAAGTCVKILRKGGAPRTFEAVLEVGKLLAEFEKMSVRVKDYPRVLLALEATEEIVVRDLRVAAEELVADRCLTREDVDSLLLPEEPALAS